MEFLAGEKIKLSKHMANKHAEMQMIQRVLAGTAEREDERALDKIGRMRNADEGRIGIELPPLNAALVEVHRELATVRNGAKDMVTKNKRLKKQEKYAQGQLTEAQRQISELQEQHHAQPVANQQLTASNTQDELRNLETALAKTQKAAKKELGKLQDELRQSSDWETSVRVQAWKALKEAQEKLQEQVTAHKRTLEALTKHINMEAWEQKILELQEEAKKQKQWFEDHLASSADLAKQVEQILKNQIARMEERQAKEAQLWADIKLQYEVRAQGHTAKINTLKQSLDEMRAKTDMGTERICTLLNTHRGRFEKQLTEALAKGWAGWTQVATSRGTSHLPRGS